MDWGADSRDADEQRVRENIYRINWLTNDTQVYTVKGGEGQRQEVVSEQLMAQEDVIYKIKQEMTKPKNRDHDFAVVLFSSLQTYRHGWQ